jgi:hypothetical protein
MVKGSVVVVDGIGVAASADPIGTKAPTSAKSEDAAMHFATVRAMVEFRLM